VVALVIVADQVTKALVERAIPLHESIAVIPGLLNLTHVQNTGAAFGLLNTAEFAGKPWLVMAMAIVALVAIVFYAGRFAGEAASTRYGLALVLAGAVGNLLDRVRAGHVVDFVDAYWRGWHFWAFNVADAAITVGAGLILIDMLFLHRSPGQGRSQGPKVPESQSP
jgi:signal peptidase II